MREGMAVEISEDVLKRIADHIELDLEIENIDLEARDVLERLVIVSIGLYVMELRESVIKTTEIKQ